MNWSIRRRCHPENPFTSIQIKVILFSLFKIFTELGIAFVHIINVKLEINVLSSSYTKLKVQERKLLQERLRKFNLRR